MLVPSYLFHCSWGINWGISLCLIGSTFLHAPAQGLTHAACHMTQQQGISAFSTDCRAVHHVNGFSALKLTRDSHMTHDSHMTQLPVP